MPEISLPKKSPNRRQSEPDAQNTFDGVLRCSRYAFGPNRLHYCGPDANREIFDYLDAGFTDLGLEALLQGFRTMYPYLKHIAEANNIRDPFDMRVVEAYWLGNELLDVVGKDKFYKHLLEEQKIKKRIGARDFELVSDKIEHGAVPHHSFHVLDIWKRTGHLEIPHTLESMDQCRISWGEIIRMNGPFIYIKTEPLVIHNGKLALGEAIEKKITRNLDSDISVDELKPGDLVSMHWGVICESISAREAENLKKYTLRHLALANRTI